MRFQLFCSAKIATWTELLRLGLENLLAIPSKAWDISKRFDFNVFRRKKQHQIALGGSYAYFARVAHRLPFRTAASTKSAERPASDSLPFYF
jgi:hypothetical protein